MARKNKDGFYILSAGEIGSYTVCPESWRLRVMQKSEAEATPSKELGQELHKSWAVDFEKSIKLSRGIRMLIYFTLIGILLTILRY